MHPFLSAIIVTHNAAPFVADCLQSLRRACLRLREATGQTAEIIVLDNASCDETIAVVRRFPDVTLLVNEDNEGFAAGIHRGAQLASGEWLLVLNPDCVLDENALVALHDFLAPHPSSPDPHRIGVVGFQLLHPDGRLQPSGRRFPKVWEFALAALGFQRCMETRWFAGRNFSVPQEVDEVSGAAFAIRRAAFEQVGGIDDGFFLFFEELDLCRRLKAAGWRIVSLPTAKASHAWAHRSSECLRWLASPSNTAPCATSDAITVAPLRCLFALRCCCNFWGAFCAARSDGTWSVCVCSSLRLALSAIGGSYCDECRSCRNASRATSRSSKGRFSVPTIW
jgi:N-acetylglucosaminyl-diphospho-decaprenol L-rhamnosyltransferase